MPTSNISKRVMAETPQAKREEAEKALAAQGLDPVDAGWIKAKQAIDDEYARQTADKITIPKGKRFIIQEIKVDAHNTIRRLAELTPSMCRERNCGYDAAKEIGYTAGWETVPGDQILPSGKTLGDAVLDLLNHHIQSAHGIRDSHILSEEEAANLGGWAPMPGQDQFLSTAKG